MSAGSAVSSSSSSPAAAAAAAAPVLSRAEEGAAFLRRRFGRADRLFFPVVHIDGVHDVDTVRCAVRNGADGVFLIDHAPAPGERLLERVYARVRAEFTDLFIGVNFLDAGRLDEAFARVPLDADALWTDAAHVDERHGAGDELLRAMRVRDERGWRGIVFGGVAFKYQRAVALADLHALGRHARAALHVPCTSGPGTGQAASIERLRALRGGLDDGAGAERAVLALASGVDERNVRGVLAERLVQCFLVASSIAGPTFHTLDGDKVRRLADVVHGGADGAE